MVFACCDCHLLVIVLFVVRVLFARVYFVVSVLFHVLVLFVWLGLLDCLLACSLARLLARLYTCLRSCSVFVFV